MILTHQFVNEVHDGNKIMFCPNCSRILFFRDDENSFLAGDSVEEADDAEDEEQEED